MRPRHKPRNSHKIWTDLDKDYVQDAWGDKSIKGIAIALGRTQSAIISYAERNNLGGCTQNTKYFLSTTDVADLLSVDRKTILLWIKSAKLKAQFKAMKKRKVYRIDILDLLDFLKANPDRWKAKEEHLELFPDEDAYWIKNKIKADEQVVFRHERLWTIKEEELMLKLIAEGNNLIQIAEVLGRSHNSVRHRKSRFYKEGKLKR